MADVNQTFNINAAVRHLVSHAHKKSIHYCAQYVANAMFAGGLIFTRKASAYMYAGYLPQIGFECLATKTGRKSQNEWTQKYAKAGDIAVMAHGQHGHICMYSGTQWISDFKQKNAWVYSSEGTVSFFRFTGKSVTDVNELRTIQQSIYQSGTTVATQDEEGNTVFTNYSQGGNIFASPESNEYSLATLNNSSISNTDTNHTRIYSSNNATITLDELSMVVDDGTGGTVQTEAPTNVQ